MSGGQFAGFSQICNILSAFNGTEFIHSFPDRTESAAFSDTVKFASGKNIEIESAVPVQLRDVLCGSPLACSEVPEVRSVQKHALGKIPGTVFYKNPALLRGQAQGGIRSYMQLDDNVAGQQHFCRNKPAFGDTPVAVVIGIVLFLEFSLQRCKNFRSIPDAVYQNIQFWVRVMMYRFQISYSR